MNDGWTYRLEYVRCGKPGCKMDRHGPYWYRYRQLARRMQKEYVGKRLPGLDARDLDAALMGLGKAARKVLVDAFRRQGDYRVCPTPGLWGATQASVLRVLERRSLIAGTFTPCLTELGRLVAQQLGAPLA